MFTSVDPNPTGDGAEDEEGKKKMRTTFTGKQIFELERSFEAKKYLSSAERAELALSLAVTQQQVCLLTRENCSSKEFLGPFTI